MKPNNKSKTDSPALKEPKKSKSDTPAKKGEEEESFTYDPVHFVRSHSKKDDPADTTTQIWEVVFEPDPEDISKTTSHVATCGGNTICVIDVNSGTVLMRFKHKDTKENFYTLAWTTLDLKQKGSGETKKTSILASGGSRGEVRLFHTDLKLCYHEWSPVDKKTPEKEVHTLLFHTSEPTWLFCGTKDGVVSLWDIGTPILPRFEGVSPKQLLKLLPDYGDVYNIAWSGNEMNWLLAGMGAGLVGWHIDVKKIKEDSSKYKPPMVDFLLPESERDNGENPIVDSLAVVSETTIVAKCALHGLIYVWDLKATVKDLPKNQTKMEDLSKKLKTQAKMEDLSKTQANSIEKDATMLATLRWSDTDNFYMNLSCHKGKGLVVCGDDKGSLWLYNLPQMVKHNAIPIKGVVEPTKIIMWPEMQDDQFKNSKVKMKEDLLKNSRKAPLKGGCDIIIDKVAVSHENLHIVAVTSNNIVCIWRRTDNAASSHS